MEQIGGIEHTFLHTHLTGNYLISIWADRLACLWLYAWLTNWWLNSQPFFSHWGFSNVSMQGTDLDPQLQFLPEKEYIRHFTLTATRFERALSLKQLEAIDRWLVEVLPSYATIRVEERLP